MEQSKHRIIRWGIIGLGNIAHKFAQDLLKVDDAQLYAVASRNLSKATRFSETYHVSQAYGNYEDLVKDPNVDAIYIATPHSLHKENTLLCLQNKKAVLCEKPFAMNYEEVKEMISTSKANETLLMEALWTYFLPHYQFVLKEIKNKSLGELKRLEADFGFKPEFDPNSRIIKKSLGGGSLLDIGIYPIFASLSSLGIPEQIEASASFFDNRVDSSCSMKFIYKNKVSALLQSTLLKETPTEAIFYFDHGIIKLNSRFHEPTTVTVIDDKGERTLDFDYDSIGYYYEIMHFNALLRAGKTESDVMTFDFSKNLIKTLDAVRQKIGLHY
jgi:predicted dehydrogenase